MTRPTNRPAVELRAELVAEDAYNYGRSAGYLDLGGSRRERMVNRLEDQAHRQARAEGYDRLEEVELTSADVRAAFLRVARRRLSRDHGYQDHRAPAVRNALRRAAVTLTLGTYADGTVEDFGGLLAEVGIDGPLERITRRCGRRGSRGAGVLTVEA